MAAYCFVLLKRTKHENTFQEGLNTYLEWLIVDSLDNSTELNEIISEKRRESIMKDSTVNKTLTFDPQTHDDIRQCSDKAALFFVMLETGFGHGTITKLIRSLLTEYALNSAGLEEWQQTITKVTGNEFAGEFFKRYFTEPGLPLVRVSGDNGQLTLSQRVTVEKRDTDQPPKISPLDVQLGETERRAVLLLTNRTQSFALNGRHSMLLLDPDARAHAVIIYEPEAYVRLLHCTQRNACASKLGPSTLRHVTDDFCWAFLGDQFKLALDDERQDVNRARVWLELLTQFARYGEVVRGPCACCLDKHLQRSGTISCKWYWQDVCSKLEIIKAIQRYEQFRRNPSKT